MSALNDYEDDEFYEDDFTDNEDDEDGRGSSKGLILDNSKPSNKQFKAFTTQASVQSGRSGISKYCTVSTSYLIFKFFQFVYFH